MSKKIQYNSILSNQKNALAEITFEKFSCTPQPTFASATLGIASCSFSFLTKESLQTFVDWDRLDVLLKNFSYFVSTSQPRFHFLSQHHLRPPTVTTRSKPQMRNHCANEPTSLSLPFVSHRNKLCSTWRDGALNRGTVAVTVRNQPVS